MDNNFERRGLLQFVPPNFLPITVLLIEDAEYLSGLRELLPAAQILIATEQELPSEEKIFDLIIAKDILTFGDDFYLRLLGLNHLLRDSGALLTQFLDEKWTKQQIVKLLSDSTYKEIHFLPEDSEKIWLVKACKCTAEVAALKEFFAPEVRADLSRLLHRIEYDIDVEENFQRLTALREREGIFDEYLNDFISQVVIHEAAQDFIRERLVI